MGVNGKGMLKMSDERKAAITSTTGVVGVGHHELVSWAVDRIDIVP